MRTKILVVAAIVGALALGGVAVASQRTGPAPTPADGTTTTDDTATPDDSASASPPAPGTGISVERAIRIALDRTGGGTVDEVEREFEDGRWVWSVRIDDDGTRKRVDVDTRTGEVVRVDTDRDDDDDRDDRDDRRGGDDDRDRD